MQQERNAEKSGPREQLAGNTDRGNQLEESCGFLPLRVWGLIRACPMDMVNSPCHANILGCSSSGITNGASVFGHRQGHLLRPVLRP